MPRQVWQRFSNTSTCSKPKAKMKRDHLTANKVKVELTFNVTGQKNNNFFSK